MLDFRRRKQSTPQAFSRPIVEERPPRLSYNPSEWRSRLPILVLALAGFCIALYLALYQWGVVKTVWEPFFRDGSKRVLHSFVSRLLPVPDAFLGALGYLADLVTGLIGGSRRCRTMPKAVLIYGVTVCLVGATALGLALLQPLLFHAGCTLCLTSAVISICIVWLASHEVWASIHHIRNSRGLSSSLPVDIT
jgi:Vitamin K epoxide reductase family